MGEARTAPHKTRAFFQGQHLVFISSSVTSVTPTNQSVRDEMGGGYDRAIVVRAQLLDTSDMSIIHKFYLKG